MIQIRLFDGSDADYERMTAIDSAVFPRYPIAMEEWQHIDAARDARRLFVREIVLDDDDVIAFGEYGHSQHSYHPHRFFIQCLVHPQHERTDIRPLYFAHVLEALTPHQPIALTTGMLEDRPEYIRFFDEQGYVPVLREPLSELDLARFDAAGFEGHEARLQAAGIRIVTLSELPDRLPDWKRRLYDLDWKITRDVPSHEPATRPSFEHFEMTRLAGPGFLPQAYFVALDGDELVAMSSLDVNVAKKEVLRTKLTGTVRSHRRRGIATALKLRAVAFARQFGARAIETGNEESNPMFALNQRLGFEPLPAWVVYEKTLRSDGGESTA